MTSRITRSTGSFSRNCRAEAPSDEVKQSMPAFCSHTCNRRSASLWSSTASTRAVGTAETGWDAVFSMSINTGSIMIIVEFRAGRILRWAFSEDLQGISMNALLSQLKQFSIIVADTGDFESIRKYQPRDATTNPTLLQKAAEMPEYSELVQRVLREVKSTSIPASQHVQLAFDRLAIAFGIEILKIVPNRVSTEVDARLSFDLPASVRKAKEIIEMYQKAGIS